jgi:hypothetical protein
MSTLPSEKDGEGGRIKVSEQLGHPLSGQILAHGVRCALPPYDSIPGSRVRLPFSCRGSVGPASPRTVKGSMIVLGQRSPEMVRRKPHVRT